MAGAILATAIAIPTRVSLAVAALALIPAAVLYVRALREAHDAHAEDPFDPLELARRRIEHAVEWNRRQLHRLAVTELAGVVDLVRTAGVELDPATVARLDALRSAAMSTWPLDTRELDWAMEQADALMARLDVAGPLAGSGAVGRAAPTRTSRSTATDPRRSSRTRLDQS